MERKSSASLLMKILLSIMMLLIAFDTGGWNYSIWTNSTLKIVKITSHKVKIAEDVIFPLTSKRYVTNTILRAEFQIFNLPTIGSFSITSGSGTNVLDLNESLYHSRLSVTFDETYTNIVEIPDYLGNDLTFPQPKIQVTEMESTGGYRHNKIEHSITTWINICFTNRFPADFKFFTRLPKVMPPMIFWKLHVIEYLY